MCFWCVARTESDQNNLLRSILYPLFTGIKNNFRDTFLYAPLGVCVCLFGLIRATIFRRINYSAYARLLQVEL